MNCNHCIHKPVCKDVNQANIYTKPATCRHYLKDRNCIIAPFDITQHLHDELSEVAYVACMDTMRGEVFCRIMIPLHPYDETEE